MAIYRIGVEILYSIMGVAKPAAHRAETLHLNEPVRARTGAKLRDWYRLLKCNGQLVGRCLVEAPEGLRWVVDSRATLSESLGQQHLSILALAYDEKGYLVDCYGGREAIKNKLLCFTVPNYAAVAPECLATIAEWLAWLPSFSISLDAWKTLIQLPPGPPDWSIVRHSIVSAMAAPAPSRYFRLLHSLDHLDGWFPFLGAAARQNETKWQAVLDLLDSTPQEDNALRNLILLTFVWEELGMLQAKSLHYALECELAWRVLTEVHAKFCQAIVAHPDQVTVGSYREIHAKLSCAPVAGLALYRAFLHGYRLTHPPQQPTQEIIELLLKLASCLEVAS